jgi:hypothetical protein
LKSEFSSDKLVIIITGSRYLVDPEPVIMILSEYINRMVILYHGDNLAGVDTHAYDFVNKHGSWIQRRHAARWNLFGDRAGPIRNSEMVQAAHVEAQELDCAIQCLAFPGPRSIGTYDCARKAQALNIPTRYIKVPQ